MPRKSRKPPAPAVRYVRTVGSQPIARPFRGGEMRAHVSGGIVLRVDERDEAHPYDAARLTVAASTVEAYPELFANHEPPAAPDEAPQPE